MKTTDAPGRRCGAARWVSEERRAHVRVPLPVEALGGRLGERHRLEDAGGVDEDVDPSEGVDSRADDRLGRIVAH